MLWKIVLDLGMFAGLSCDRDIGRPTLSDGRPYKLGRGYARDHSWSRCAGNIVLYFSSGVDLCGQEQKESLI